MNIGQIIEKGGVSRDEAETLVTLPESARALFRQAGGSLFHHQRQERQLQHELSLLLTERV